MWASSHGHLNIVQALLHLSVTDVNIRNIDDRTALFFASFGGHTTVVQALLGDSRVNSTLHDKVSLLRSCYFTFKDACSLLK